MRTILITSMLAFGLGCGAAVAQSEQSGQAAQPGGSGDCATGSANCKNGGSTEQQSQGNADVKTDDQAQGKAGTTTDQQTQGNAGATTDQQAQGKASAKTDQQTQGNAGATTDMQAQGKAGTKTDQQTQGKAGATTNMQAQGKAGTKTDQQTQGNAGTTDQNSTASINNVTVEQKTEITKVIRETNVEPVSNIDVDISVGVAVPKKVRLHRLPQRIIKIVPAYEAYEYFVLADGRIVIVDPNSFVIVAVLS